MPWPPFAGAPGFVIPAIWSATTCSTPIIGAGATWGIERLERLVEWGGFGEMTWVRDSLAELLGR